MYVWIYEAHSTHFSSYLGVLVSSRLVSFLFDASSIVSRISSIIPHLYISASRNGKFRLI